VATFLLVQGLDPVELADSYNFVRKRLNDAAQAKIDYENGTGEKFQPFHSLSFKTAENGRITVNPEKVIGCGSDEPKDQGEAEE